MGPRLFRAILYRAVVPTETDAELLGRFAATRDEAAFAELVRRYGGLVWGQCRHLLPSEADAEDAFQATFLALARRPDAVRTAVGPYLHGVAYRVCLNARRLAGRRKKREAVAAVPEAQHPVADSAWDAALAAVHDEIHRLPDPQRVAFVLCVLEGRGLTDAAAELGVKLGTLSARLSRAKQTVMERLTAKGILAGMAAVAALAPAGVTAAVVEKAVQTAVGAAVVPAAVHSLTHGVTKMVAFKLKVLAAGVLLACGLGLGVGSGWVATAQDIPLKPLPSKQRADEANRLLERQLWEEDEKRRKADAEERAEELRGMLELMQAAQKRLLVRLQPEFKYVPLVGDGVMSTKDFEKVVAENEADGYKFVGSVPLAGKKFLNKIEEEAIPTLVFRKKPADRPTASKDAPKQQLNDPNAEIREQIEAQQERTFSLAREKIALERDLNLLRERADAIENEKSKLDETTDELIRRLRLAEKQPAAKLVAPAPAAKPEKLYAVNFDNTPWRKVAEWLTKELDLTLVGDVMPQGTCTIKLKPKRTAGELVDLLNDVLAQQQLTLVRGERTFRFWPADKRLPQLFVPSVRVEDLPNRGKSEIVCVIIPVKGGTAEEFEKDAKKLKSPRGEVVAVGQSQLFVCDRADVVMSIHVLIQKMEK